MGAGPRYGDADEEAAALLRARLRLADEQIETPAGLWARVREQPGAGRSTAGVWARRRPLAVALAVAAAVAAVALGVWWLVRPGPVDIRPAGPPGTMPVTVYNSEEACRTGRTLECALRLAKDPHTAYAARGNLAGRVWHGEVLWARCVASDGQLLRDEEGVTSTRWYRVTGVGGVSGWLPGVRTRNTREVPECPAGER
ncbi:hypothetical protein [Streptomyces sp. YGL11-2]|uniref:hypothetical protein n=1 Tax=Streptomyces sp. YGL11-2 TaxID=3414028 RepID=UPI003CF81201